MVLSFVILYLLATVFVGALAARRVKSASDFAVAGKKLPTFMVSCGLFATWFGSETMMGATGEFVEHGVLGVIEDPLGAAACLIFVGLFYAKPLYRMKLLTFSDYFKLRFGKTSEFISAILVIPSYFSWIAAQLVAMAFILQSLADIPFTYGVIICALVVVIYTYYGGMWSVSITDTIQTVIIIIGLLILFGELWGAVGGWEKINSHVPPDFWRIIPKENSWENWIIYFAAWITIGWGSIPQQDVFQRVMAAKSESVAVKGSLLSGLMYFTVALLPLMIALCAHMLYPNVEEKQMIIPEVVMSHMGIGFQIITFGALLSAILSTCSGAILAPATVLAENLIQPFKKLNDKGLLQTMRFSVLGIALVSTFLALQKTNIFELVADSSAFSLVSLFVPLTAGLYWKKASNWGAILSMIFGIILWTYLEFYPAKYPSLLYGLAASIIGMVLGSFLQNIRLSRLD